MLLHPGTHGQGPVLQRPATSCLSLKEAQKQLADAANLFALPIKEALELWLEITDELPSHTQHPHTAAATHLVQAALQQAPRPMESFDPKQLVWLQKHLPGISTAMQDSISSQINTSIRRTSIAQSLARAQPDDAQLCARAQAEYSTCAFLEPSSLVFFLLFPVGALCDALSPSTKARQQGVNSQQGRHHHHPQHRLQQGNELISMVGADLSHRAGIRAQLEEQRECITTLLEGVRWMPPRQLLENFVTAQTQLARASALWLYVVMRLPPGHKDVVLFLDSIHWKMALLRPTTDQDLYGALKSLLLQLLGEPQLVQHWDRQKPDLLREVVLFLVSTPQRYQGPGAPGIVQRQLIAFMQDIQSDAPSDAQHVPRQHNQQAGGQLPAGSNHTSGSSQGVGDDSNGSAAADASEADVASAGDNDLDDMQALLRLMYGSTVHSGHPDPQP